MTAQVAFPVVDRSGRSSPMHAGYSDGEDSPAEGSFPPAVRPTVSKSEEDAESGEAGHDRDDGGSNHVLNSIRAGIVIHAQLA